jgi:hypothetical protein
MGVSSSPPHLLLPSFLLLFVLRSGEIIFLGQDLTENQQLQQKRQQNSAERN